MPSASTSIVMRPLKPSSVGNALAQHFSGAVFVYYTNVFMEYDEFGLAIIFLQKGTIDRHNHLLISNPFSSSKIELHITACGP